MGLGRDGFRWFERGAELGARWLRVLYGRGRVYHHSRSLLV